MGTDIVAMPPPSFPTAQQRMERRLGGAIGFGLDSHELDLEEPTNLKWFPNHASGSHGNVPFDLMVIPIFALRRHSGTDFFSSPSQFFCTRFTAGICPYGAACNKRHEPFAEVVCVDWLAGHCNITPHSKNGSKKTNGFGILSGPRFCSRSIASI